jgi:hypothetical protein
MKLIESKLLRTNMKTIKLQSHIGADGMLQIQTATDLKDTSVEVVVVVQPLADTTIAASSESEPRYNAWGKPTTKKSISDAISRIQQLRREVALDKGSIRSMIEERRRF